MMQKYFDPSDFLIELKHIQYFNKIEVNPHVNIDSQNYEYLFEDYLFSNCTFNGISFNIRSELTFDNCQINRFIDGSEEDNKPSILMNSCKVDVKRICQQFDNLIFFDCDFLKQIFLFNFKSNVLKLQSNSDFDLLIQESEIEFCEILINNKSEIVFTFLENSQSVLLVNKIGNLILEFAPRNISKIIIGNAQIENLQISGVLNGSLEFLNCQINNITFDNFTNAVFNP